MLSLSLSETSVPEPGLDLKPFISELGPIVLVANVLVEELSGAFGLGELLDNGRRYVVVDVGAVAGEVHGEVLGGGDVAKATHKRGVEGSGERHRRHGRDRGNEGELTGEDVDEVLALLIVEGSSELGDLLGEGVDALGEAGRGGLHGVLFLPSDASTLPNAVGVLNSFFSLRPLSGRGFQLSSGSAKVMVKGSVSRELSSLSRAKSIARSSQISPGRATVRSIVFSMFLQ